MSQKLSPRQSQLVQENISLAHSLANSYKLPPGCSRLREDLKSACYLGLCLAATRWTPQRGASFSSVAYNCMRNAIASDPELRDSVRYKIGVVLIENASELSADPDSMDFGPSLRDELRHVIDELPKDLRSVILSKYPLDQQSRTYTDAQIGKLLGFSAAWVRALRKKEFGQLKERLGELDIR